MVMMKEAETTSFASYSILPSLFCVAPKSTFEAILSHIFAFFKLLVCQ